MALDPKITNAAASAAADAVVDLCDAGAGAASLRIYDGSVPATADTAISTQVLLAQLAMSDPAFGAASNGVATASAISDDASADATGTATFFRILDSNGTVIIQGTVGTATSDLVLNTTSIVAGATVSVTSLTYTQPKG
jgi:hypothetical protein